MIRWALQAYVGNLHACAYLPDYIAEVHEMAAQAQEQHISLLCEQIEERR